MVPGIVFAGKPVNMHIYIKGKDYSYEEQSQAIVKDNRICLPVRYISELMDYKVSWDDKERSVELKKDDTVVKMKIGKKQYTVNGEKKKLDTAPFITENRTYLPMRYVGEALGETVRWDEANRIAEFGDYPHVTDVKGTKYTVSDGFSFKIPDNVKDQFVCENTTEGIVLYEKTNHDSRSGFNGLLGTFFVTDKPEYEVSHLILRKKGDKYLTFDFVSDVNYDLNNPALTKAYKDAENRINEILETVEVTE